MITKEQLDAHMKWILRAQDGKRLVLPDANLQYANLQYANLQGADLRGANLQGADLHSAYLQYANLQGADLHSAYLQYANLQGANLHSAYLQCANLHGAYLQYANLHGAELKHANLHGANLQLANLQRAELHGADLRGADMRGVQGIKIASDAAERLLNVARAALAENALEMKTWHTCDTTHCIAGWAIHQAGEPGRIMEEVMGPSVAGLYLLGTEAHQYFWESNEGAAKFLQSVLDGTAASTGIGSEDTK